MLKKFIAYVVNAKSGKGKEVVIYAQNSSKAREYAETLIIKRGEKVLSVFPYSLCA